MINDILGRLKGVKKNGTGYTARCPAHDDQKNSLSVKTGDDGRILLHCFSGCTEKGQTPQRILGALGLNIQDIMPANGFAPSYFNPPPPIIDDAPQRKEIGREFEGVYPYADESGEVLYENVRILIKFDDGTTDKTFYWQRVNVNGHCVNGLGDIRRVPYRLPELIELCTLGYPLWLCEGEKDADRLADAGLNSSNLKNWKPEFRQHLPAGQIVILCVDHDKAGHQLANATAALLAADGYDVRWLDLYAGEPLPGKHGLDVSDWLNAGNSLESLYAAGNAAPRWQSPSEPATVETLQEPEPASDEANWPVLPDVALYGLAGDYVRLVEPHTEADAAAVLGHFLIGAGNLFGRNAYALADGAKHYLNLYGAVVGKTSSGGKGSSWAHVRNFFKLLEPKWAKANVKNGGLTSGQGLLFHVRDDLTEWDSEKQDFIITKKGVDDKRLFVVEGELGSVLKLSKGETNTLTAQLRTFWDTGDADSLAKNSPYCATDAHISLVGHITKEELINLLNVSDAYNGLFNRLLWVCARRSKYLPDGGNLRNEDLRHLVADMHRVLDYAQTVTLMERTEEARALWHEVYAGLCDGRAGMWGAVTARAAAQVLRLSCLYAVLDCSNVVCVQHLQAALAFWKYCEESAKVIFGVRTGNKLADDLLELLRAAGAEGLTGEELYTLTGRNQSAAKMAAALTVLAEAGLATNQRERKGDKGRYGKRWFATEQN